MASEEKIQSINVDLPLLLQTRKEDGYITESGLKDVAKDLKQDLILLQRHIHKQKNLSFVSIKDVSFEGGQINLTFDIADEAQLNNLYRSLKSTDNDVSKCLSSYFAEMSMETVAGLRLLTVVTCQVLMTKAIFLKCSLELCEKEDDIWKEIGNNSHSHDTTLRKGSNVEGAISGNSVKQQVQELNKKSVQAFSTNTSDNSSSSSAKPKKVVHSSSETTAREPGSYQYDNKEQAVKEQVAMMTRRFLLYFPYIKGWKVKQMLIKSDCSYLNGEMKPHNIDIYEYIAEIPEDQQFYSFHYVCQLKSDRMLNFSLTATPPIRSISYRLQTFYIQRDSWITSGERVHNVDQFDENSVNVHLADMLYHCTHSFDIGESCKQVETICASRLRRANAINVLKHLAVDIPSSNRAAKLLFAVSIGNILSNLSKITLEEFLDSSLANSIMTAIRTYRIEALPESCLNYLYTVCFYLCRLIFGSSMWEIQYLNTTYPFYSDDYLLNRVQECVQSCTQISSDRECFFNVALELCQKLYTTSLETSSDKGKNTDKAMNALDILLRHLPSNMTLFIVSNMQLSSKDMSLKESDLQNLLHSTSVVRIDTDLRACKKNRDIRRLRELWKNLTGLYKSNLSIELKFKEAIMSILKSYSSTEGIADIVVEFVSKYKFFHENIDKRELLKIIMESQTESINELFFTLVNCKEMASDYLSIENDQFKSFCRKFVEGKENVCSGRDKEFLYFLNRVCRIWDIPLLNRNARLNDIIIGILQRELDNYRTKQLIQHLKIVDKIADRNENMADVFIGHIEKTLEETTERPEDFMENLPTYKDKRLIFRPIKEL